MSKKNFQGTLGEYIWEETEDGSYTLHSTFFSENCHSTAGAVAETQYNYVEGCEVLHFLLKHRAVHIFEVGFGTGIGLETTLVALKSKLEQNDKVLFTSCELDKELTHYSLEALKEKGTLETYHWDEELQVYQGRAGIVEINIIVGDIRKRISLWSSSKYYQKIDCLYQDAFSPKKSPSLWTYEWFLELGKHSHSHTVMGTYSSTKSVWKAMVRAGWIVKMVPGHGLKKISTRAYRQGEMSEEILELMRRSPVDALCD